MSYSLFFECYEEPRDLHSFPTRRSSDLVLLLTEEDFSRYIAATGGRPDGVTANSASLEVTPRSEEHTSELQSQSNLVCRLLLEKKKKSGAPDGTDAGRRVTKQPQLAVRM